MIPRLRTADRPRFFCAVREIRIAASTFPRDRPRRSWALEGRRVPVPTIPVPICPNRRCPTVIVDATRDQVVVRENAVDRTAGDVDRLVATAPVIQRDAFQLELIPLRRGGAVGSAVERWLQISQQRHLLGPVDGGLRA